MSSINIRELKLNYGPVEVLKTLDLDIHDGEFIVLLGPSGCGKSTLLNCIAGLMEITDGQIFINGRNVTWEEPKDRGIGMVFQSYALYPQMSVRGNLSFGLKNKRVPQPEIDQRIARAAEILQIEPLLDRKPAQLSGGQRQRVAIGRALVRDVDVFLFDEPLSNLDAKLRADLRVEIKRLHQRLKNTMIYVTHDQIEALTLADRIAIMRSGVIQQLADPQTIYNKPSNLYVAGFIGSPAMNFIDGTLEGETFVAEDGTQIPIAGYSFEIPSNRQQEAVLGIRPEHIFLGAAAEAMPYRAAAVIEVIEPMGSETLAWTKVAGKPVTFRCASDISLSIGEKVTIGFNVARGSLFNKQSTLRL